MRLLPAPACAILAVLLAACAGSPPGLPIDRSIQAQSQNSRVEFVVLHYTSAPNERSLALLSRHGVSSHYLITDEPRPRVYQLVDESQRAWHAGASQWYGRTWLNAASIGVEIVNAGLIKQENRAVSSPPNAPKPTQPQANSATSSQEAPNQPPAWAPYSDAQIETLRLLLADIVQRHRIEPRNIVGHSDISPQRKVDPGPLFPWKKLAEAGLGRWYDETLAARYQAELQAEFERGTQPDAAWIQAQLARAGYETPQSGALDSATRKVIAAFQMHYRPRLYDGQPDAETLGILKSLP